MKLSYRRTTLNVSPQLLHRLGRRMRYVKAAGGIVTAPDGSMLLIERNGRWDLPKGKVEAGESLHQAALREVAEETGVGNLVADAHPLVKTYHIYNLYGGWHLKQTAWFEMRCLAPSPLVPQQEEGITACCWATPEEWHKRLGTSYGTLQQVAWIHSHK